MGFFKDIKRGVKDIGVGGDFGPAQQLRAFTGQTGAEASLEGSRMQIDAASEGREQLRSDLNPFRMMGVDLIPSTVDLASDPTAQLDYLTNNPLFSALQQQSQDAIFGNRAAAGKLASGGTQEALQNSFLTLGNSLIDQQINRTLPLIKMGQASAAQSAAGSADLLTQAGNAAAAGGIGAANAYGQGGQNAATAAGAAAKIISAFSDENLKTNVTKIGEHNGIDVYKWDWNEYAEELGLTGSGSGHLAQELEETHPHLVADVHGIKMVNYGTNETVEPRLWQ